MDRVLLVIPCFKERRRLPTFLDTLLPAISESRLPVDILAVDDGSGEGEAKFLENLVAERHELWSFLHPALLLDRNRGKGGAVFAGWDRAKADTHRWLAFVDADGAVSADEIRRVLALIVASAETIPENKTSWFAVRTGSNGTTVQRTPVRRVTGKVFALLVRILFRMPVPDTQCGFKIVPRTWFIENREQLIEERFCFDIEMAYWLLQRDISIESVPISWTETPGSHLGLNHVLQMFTSLLVLRRRLE